MKTLIINGSPRSDGETVSLLRLLRHNLEGEHHIVDVYRQRITPCVDCRYCCTHLGCCVPDDMQKVYDYLQECNNVVIASPIYFSQVTPPVFNLGSRLQIYYSAQQFRGKSLLRRDKKGAVILVGGGDGGSVDAYITARRFLKVMGCREVYDMVCFHSADKQHAMQDEKTVQGVTSIAEYLNKSL